MEMANGQGQGSDTQVSQPGLTSATSTAQQSAPVTAPEERTFRQSDVDRIVQKVKHETEERLLRMRSDQPQYVQQKEAGLSAMQSQQSAAYTGGLPENEIRRMAAEEAQRLRDQWVQDAQKRSQEDQAKRTVQNFWSKIAPGKEKYQDFDKVTGDIEYARFPSVVQILADHVENPHDVLYELGKDRIRMSNLEVLAERSPRDAILQAQRFAQSIKDNESAANVRMPNPPLHQMRPSNTGTDNGVMSVKDYRAKYRG